MCWSRSGVSNGLKKKTKTEERWRNCGLPALFNIVNIVRAYDVTSPGNWKESERDRERESAGEEDE